MNSCNLSLTLDAVIDGEIGVELMRGEVVVGKRVRSAASMRGGEPA